jgi:hypothetical protein
MKLDFTLCFNNLMKNVGPFIYIFSSWIKQRIEIWFFFCKKILKEKRKKNQHGPCLPLNRSATAVPSNSVSISNEYWQNHFRGKKMRVTSLPPSVFSKCMHLCLFHSWFTFIVIAAILNHYILFCFCWVRTLFQLWKISW